MNEVAKARLVLCRSGWPEHQHQGTKNGKHREDDPLIHILSMTAGGNDGGWGGNGKGVCANIGWA